VDELAPLSVAGDPATGETAYVWVKLPAKDGSTVSTINALYFDDD
jgi:hypothetical protein